MLRQPELELDIVGVAKGYVPIAGGGKLLDSGRLHSRRFELGGKLLQRLSVRCGKRQVIQPDTELAEAVTGGWLAGREEEEIDVPRPEVKAPIGVVFHYRDIKAKQIAVEFPRPC